VAFETPNNAGSYGNNIYFLIDLPSYSYDKTDLLGLGGFTKSNITLTGGFAYDVVLFFNAPPNGFVGSSNLIIFADGTPTTVPITNIGVDAVNRFVELAIPLSQLGLTVNNTIRILGFYTGTDINATAYGAIPFTNGNGGTDGPLPPAWNASVSLNDFSTYTVK
jgi:hypothetical protein